MPTTQSQLNELLTNVLDHLRPEATRYCSGPNGVAAEPDDLLQEAGYAVVAAWPKRRPEGSAMGFAVTVGRNAMASACRRLGAAKRGGDASVRPLGECERQVDLVRQTDLRLDMTAVIAVMPPEQRLLCSQLRTYRLSRVCREGGEARGAVRSQINRMKESMSDLRKDN